jgi:hypothetical protein
MGKKHHRRQEESLLARLREHAQKMHIAALSSHPDEGLLRHWANEMRAFEIGIARARKRLGRKM